jgi:tripartite-type tricarboxylate transporter receptor subunit TctC
MVLVVHPSLPAHSVKELVALAKARPDGIAYASNGTGSLSHVTAALFMQRAGVKLLHVPYRGAAPAVIDTVAGHVSVLFAGYPSIGAQRRAGKLRALAVTSANRAQTAPDLPTMAESGFPGFESTQWWGLYGPAGLSPAIVETLNASTNKVLRMADVKKALAQDSAEPAGGTPAELAAHHKRDFEKWGKVARSAGIKGE